jgi:hypothetical protein
MIGMENHDEVVAQTCLKQTDNQALNGPGSGKFGSGTGF